MAALNGETTRSDETREDSVHLGKRKRSASPEKINFANGQDTATLQQSLNAVLAQSKKSDHLLSLIKQKIPFDSSGEPDAKRARLESAEFEWLSIEDRILSGAYKTSEEVVKDVDAARSASASASINGHTNGSRSPPTSDAVVEAANQFLQLLKSSKNDASNGEKPESPASKQHAGQIIMLRSTTDRGFQALYSGLQSESRDNKDLSKDARRLPNGFDLAEPATMDATLLAPTRQARKFGEVFGPHRNAKPLEMPRSRATFRSNTLGFTKDPFQNMPQSMNRADYRNASLSTTSYLDYAKGRALSEQDASRRYKDKNAPSNDFRAALVANDAAVSEAADPLAQFKKAFSSFAPETDSSSSAVADEVNHRSWWRRNGEKKLQKIISSSYPDLELIDKTAPEQPEDDFAGVLDFTPEQPDEEPPSLEEPETIDEVLNEISELLETVHSYQRMRSLETRPSADITKPSSDEFDTYELLRSQLAILIASVPPFALAKLDGDKLSDLNISQNIMVEGTDYRGTLQPDDFTLAKYRAAQPQTRMPQAGTPTAARPTYAPQPNLPHYGNTNLQTYQRNLSAQAAVAQRQAQTHQYSTPQNMQRGYQPYSQQGTNYSTQQPNPQQFQRPTPANGYGNWTNKASSTPVPGYAQTPSQPGYQQRAQQQAAMYQSQTPSRPMPNGQMNYQNLAAQYSQRPFVAPAQSVQGGMINGGQ